MDTIQEMLGLDMSGGKKIKVTKRKTMIKKKTISKPKTKSVPKKKTISKPKPKPKTKSVPKKTIKPKKTMKDYSKEQLVKIAKRHDVSLKNREKKPKTKEQLYNSLKRKSFV